MRRDYSEWPLELLCHVRQRMVSDFMAPPLVAQTLPLDALLETARVLVAYAAGELTLTDECAAVCIRQVESAIKVSYRDTEQLTTWPIRCAKARLSIQRGEEVVHSTSVIEWLTDHGII